MMRQRFMSFTPPSDYTLTQLIGEDHTSSMWLAEQISVRRNVVLEQLRDVDSTRREDFLASVRAKAAVDHPLIASIYEAINEADFCFFAREWLPGENLAAMMQQGITMKPVQVAHILKRIAEACMHLEERGTATDTLKASNIYINSQQVMRISNLAMAGTRSENASATDMAELGHSLPALVEAGASGATRVLTLLHWMTGGVENHTMQWKDVRHYADQIEQQLAVPVTPAQAPTHLRTTALSGKKSPRLAIILGSVTVVAAIVALMVTKRGSGKIQGKITLDGPIAIAPGMHPGPDGGNINIVRQYWLAAHEVTIGEYFEFLDSLAVLSDKQRVVYDNESQPESKVGHEPEQWPEILAAARKGQQWKGRDLSVNCPVFGVDWWDAHAYCEWKKARLPSQEEWFAAMRLQTENPLTLLPGEWGDVSQLDRNGAGFLGMAGGVSEWTRKPANNPSNPLGPKLWVLIGASYAKPASGAMARQWVAERELRRDDIGFRVAYDHLPE